MKRGLGCSLLLCGLLAACGGDCTQATSWTSVAEDALDAAQKTQRAAAFQAKDAVFQQLSGALTSTIRESGPAAAIAVCRTQAQEIAARVSGELKVTIGRTSFRLRNASNKPPAWAASLVAAEHPDNAYLAAPDGTLGVLLPIRLQNACLTCHGEPETIAVDVRTTIQDLYPGDGAMGFEQGDLRGYFWIEVPPPSE